MSTKEPTYDDAAIAEKLAALPGWYYEEGWIRRYYKTDGWPTTLMLVNAIGYVAEAITPISPSPGPASASSSRRTALAESRTRTSRSPSASSRSCSGARPRAER